MNIPKKGAKCIILYKIPFKIGYSQEPSTNIKLFNFTLFCNFGPLCTTKFKYFHSLVSLDLRCVIHSRHIIKSLSCYSW